MGSRVLAVTLAAGVALAMAVPAWADQVTGVYAHVWQAETMYGGDLGGRFEKRVDEAVAGLEESEPGVWHGSVAFSDLLAVEDASGRVSAQTSRIGLVLRGVTVEAGVSIGGTFSGTVSLRVDEAATVEEALDGVLGEPIGATDYEVTGHWGAVTSQGTIAGEILYETAAVLGAGMDDARGEAALLNRLSTMNPDALGDPQTFMIILPAESGGRPTDSGDGTDGDAGTKGGADEEPRGETFLDYVAKGLSGAEERGRMPAPVVEAAGARALRDAEPEGATALPDDAVAIGIDLSGAYLDAKNRAAALLGDDGPTGAIEDPSVRWRLAREKTVRPIAPADVDRLRFYGERVLEALEGQEEVPGAGTLIDDVGLLFGFGGGASDPAPTLKLWSDVTAATAPGPVSGDVLPHAADSIVVVLGERVPQAGPLADAVLVAADSELAREEARDLMFFERDASLDTTASIDGDVLVDRVLARWGTDDVPPAISWTTADGARGTAPGSWTAYRSPVDRVLWLAGESGDVALTDGALRGWAFTLERARLVERARTGHVLAVFALE